jgi:hypothetical protein
MSLDNAFEGMTVSGFIMDFRFKSSLKRGIYEKKWCIGKS